MKTTPTKNEDRINKLGHVSWGAIFAGFVSALSIIFLLNLLGIGIGFASINPLEESNPLEGLSWGTIIWWVLSNLIALFVGGMIAGRLAGHTDKMDGALHGALAWGLYTILSLYLITTAVGNVFGGLTSTAGSLFGGDEAKVIVDYQNSQKSGEESTDMSMGSVKNQIMQLVQRGKSLNILPEEATGAVSDVMNNPDVTAKGLIGSLDVDEFFSDLQFNLDDNGDLKITTEGNEEYFEKEKLITYLSENTDLSREEMNGLITKWERKIDEAINTAEAKYKEVKSKAIEYADEAAEAMAKFSIAAFFVLLMGLAASLFGGAVGADQLVLYEGEVEVSKTINSDR